MMAIYKYTLGDIWDKFIDKNTSAPLETRLINDAIDQWERETHWTWNVSSLDKGETDIYLEDENTLVVELL